MNNRRLDRYSARLGLSLLALPAITAHAEATPLQYTQENEVVLEWALETNTTLLAKDTFHGVEAAAGRVYALIENAEFVQNQATVRAHDAATGAELWSSTYTGDGDVEDFDLGELAISDDGSRVFLAALVDLEGFGEDIHIVAFDGATGATLWTRKHDHQFSHVYGLSVARVSPDGSRLFVGARSGSTSIFDALLFALDTSDGSLVWETEYETPDAYSDEVRVLCSSPDGAVLYAGLATRDSNDDFDIRTQAIDAATGDVLWERVHGSIHPRPDVPSAIVTDGARVIVGGSSGELDTVIAYDAVDGSDLWSDSFGGDYVEQLELSPDGLQLAALGTFPGTSFLRLRAYDPAMGTPAWETGLEGFTQQVIAATGLAYTAASDQLVAAADMFIAQPVPRNVVAWAVDPADGSPDWLETEELPAEDEFPLGLALAQTPSGSIATVAGRVGAPDGSRVRLRGMSTANPASGWDLIETGPQPEGSDAAIAPILSADGSRLWYVVREEHPSLTPLRLATIYELDQEDGSVLWSTQAEEIGYPVELLLWPGEDRLTLVGNFDAETIDLVTGESLWYSEWPGVSTFSEITRDAVLAPDGSAIYATGYATGGTGFPAETYFATVAWDAATGDELWAVTYSQGGVGLSDARALAISPDGSRLYVTGRDPNGNVQGSTALATTIAYDTSDGSEVWLTGIEFGSASGGFHTHIGPEHLEASADGSTLYLFGVKRDPVDFFEEAAITAAIDATNGDLVWLQEQENFGASIPGEIESEFGLLNPDGTVLYHLGSEPQGQTPPSPLPFTLLGLYLSAVDTATGETLWTSYEVGYGWMRPYDLALSRDGRSLYVQAEYDVINSVDPHEIIRTIAFDVETGSRLWAADYKDSSVSTGRVAAGDGTLYACGTFPGPTKTADAVLVKYAPESFLTGPPLIPLETGGQQHFLLTAPEELAGSLYWVVGSASGTSPGLGTGNGVLPLNVDDYFLLSLVYPNVEPFLNTLGVLDANGKARASVFYSTPFDASLAGAPLFHAFVVLGENFQVEFVSNAGLLVLGTVTE